MGIPFERCATCDHYLAQHYRNPPEGLPFIGLKCSRSLCGCNDFVMKEELPKKGPKRIHGVKPLWRLGSYDGPVTGICEYQGRLHYFDMLGAPGSFIGKRAYAVYKLTPVERIREWVGHQIFKLMTGDYENLNEYGPSKGKTWLRKNKHYWGFALDLHRFIRFWPKSPTRRHYETQPPIGYFTFKERGDDDE